MRTNVVSPPDGDTFVVSDRRVNLAISPEEAQGLFQVDTRFLSRWVLTVNGELPNPLSPMTSTTSRHNSFLFWVPEQFTSIPRYRLVGSEPLAKVFTSTSKSRITLTNRRI
jgi:hypothetical protein